MKTYLIPLSLFASIFLAQPVYAFEKTLNLSLPKRDEVYSSAFLAIRQRSVALVPEKEGAAIFLESDKPHYAILVTLGSYHQDEATRKSSRQINPGLGIKYAFNDTWYVAGNHVFLNSNDGSTDTLGVGFQRRVGTAFGVPLHAGLEGMRIVYRNKKKDSITTGYLPMLSLRIGDDRQAFNVGYFPKKDKGVFLFAYSFGF
jgi:hypothetical protein